MNIFDRRKIHGLIVRFSKMNMVDITIRKRKPSHNRINIRIRNRIIISIYSRCLRKCVIVSSVIAILLVIVIAIVLILLLRKTKATTTSKLYFPIKNK